MSPERFNTGDSMATATATGSDLKALLGMETMPLEEVRATVGDLELAKAWAAGEIEIGRRAYCVTGPVGKIGSVLVLEDATEWSGPKTRMHGTLRDVMKDELPKVERYKKYQLTKPERFGDEPQLKPVEISQAEALEALALLVRLTDKGLGES